MKKLLHIVIAPLLTILIILLGTLLFASTAIPYPIDIQQSDGTTLTIFLKGDETIKWAETMDEYSLLRNSKGAWEYAILNENGSMVVSGLLAHNRNQRSAAEIELLQKTKKKLFYSDEQVSRFKDLWKIRFPKGAASYDPIGTKNLILILMGYKDLAFSKTQAEFDNLMNQVNYAGIGSFRDFHLENSYGNFEINTTVVGPYTTANNMAYYGGNDASGWDLHPDELAEEAINQSDPYINYADYDLDNDGTVDAGVYVVYAGYGEEYGAAANTIWAHAASLSKTVDGVTVNRYACSSELRGTSGSTIREIGVICHEFGHTMGAPDYYDTDYATNGQYDGTGYWDLMASGNWNDDGDIPAHHNPYSKVVTYGWTNATAISTVQNVSLGDITQYDDIVQYNTTTSGEYFLCENRQLTGFNAALPGHGLMIYHVDENYINSNFSTNQINNSAHQGLYPKSGAATNSSGIHTSAENKINNPNCPWPSSIGAFGRTAFDDTSTPWSKSWAGNNTAKPLSNIAESGELSTFCFMSCDNNDISNFAAPAISSSQIDLYWPGNPPGTVVMIAYNTEPSFGIPVNGNTYSAGDNISGGGEVIYKGSSFPYSHTLLSANTTYYYKAWTVMTADNYSRGVTTSGNTQCGINSTPYNEYFGYTFIPDCWSQADHASSGNIWKFGKTDFNSIVPALAGNYAYLNSEDYGSGYSQNVDLISPAFDLSGYAGVNLQFKHYFSQKSSSTATLSYSTDGITWTIIQQWIGTTVNPATFNLSIPGAAGNPQVYFKWNFNGSNEYGWAIDDVSITSEEYEWRGYSDTNWGNQGNWYLAKIPQTNSEVIVPFVASGVYPIIGNLQTEICKDLTIESGASLTIDPGAQLNVTNTLTNNSGNSGLVIKSDNTGTGSLLHYTSNVNATVERFIEATDWSNGEDGWHLLSSPVSSQTISPAFTATPAGEYDFYLWDESTNFWVNFKNQSGGGGTSPFFDVVNGSLNFITGTGYMVSYKNQTTNNFTGVLNNDDVELTGLPISSGNNKGWHLLGNPFPSSLIWDHSWNKTNIGNSIYVWNEIGNSYTAINADDGNAIPMANGFMVLVTSGTGSITIPSDHRVHDAQSWYKDSGYPIIRLLARNLDKPSFQKIQIRFNPAATVEFDSDHDGPYISGYAPQFYSTVGEEKLMVNSLPKVTKETVIPLSFIKNKGTKFAIELEEFKSISSEFPVILLDKLTGIKHNLSENNLYQFNSDDNDKKERFELHFSNKPIEDECSPFVTSVYYRNGTLHFETISEDVKLEFISTHGQLVKQRQVSGSGSHSVNIHLSAGVYIIRFSDNESSQTSKMVIH